MRRIFTDQKRSVLIRLIRLIRVPFLILKGDVT